MSNSYSQHLPPVTFETANDAQREILEAVKKNSGMVPNLMATMTQSPTLMKGFMAMNAVFGAGTFTNVEQQLIDLAASQANGCHYCIAAHGTVLKKMMRVDAATVDPVKRGELPEDPKLAALVATSYALVHERGRISQATIDQFLSVGYTYEQLFELLLGVALKTITNYMDHFNPVELDPAFQAEA